MGLVNENSATMFAGSNLRLGLKERMTDWAMDWLSLTKVQVVLEDTKSIFWISNKVISEDTKSDILIK